MLHCLPLAPFLCATLSSSSGLWNCGILAHAFYSQLSSCLLAGSVILCLSAQGTGAWEVWFLALVLSLHSWFSGTLGLNLLVYQRAKKLLPPLSGVLEVTVVIFILWKGL